jgi:hypothetical protein
LIWMVLREAAGCTETDFVCAGETIDIDTTRIELREQRNAKVLITKVLTSAHANQSPISNVGIASFFEPKFMHHFQRHLPISLL